MPSRKKISSSKLRAIIEKTFNEFPDMDQGKDGMHEPHLHTANHILRKALAEINPEMAYSYEARAPYWTRENTEKAYKALVSFYKERGILARKFKKLKFSRTPESMRIETGKSSRRSSKQSKSSKHKSSKGQKSSKTKKCPEGKIRNPSTGRCVDMKGTIGKKLSKKQRSKSSSSTSKKSKPCPSGKIRNPATGRCVSRTSALGKVLSKK